MFQGRFVTISAESPSFSLIFISLNVARPNRRTVQSMEYHRVIYIKEGEDFSDEAVGYSSRICIGVGPTEIFENGCGAEILFELIILFTYIFTCLTFFPVLEVNVYEV